MIIFFLFLLIGIVALTLILKLIREKVIEILRLRKEVNEFKKKIVEEPLDYSWPPEVPGYRERSDLEPTIFDQGKLAESEKVARENLLRYTINARRTASRGNDLHRGWSRE
jgi:hypothetical protein